MQLGEIAILEQWIDQHPLLSQIYPDAINCLRIITVLKDNKLHFIAGGITWGNGAKIANASASGIVSPVDFQTGILNQAAADFHGNSFSTHPLTGEKLTGFQIPLLARNQANVRKGCKSGSTSRLCWLGHRNNPEWPSFD